MTGMYKAYARLLICVLLFSTVLAGCSSDGYDSGDGRYSYLRADFVNMYAGAGKYVYYVVTDEGERLSVDPPFTVSWITTPDSVYRALLYYNLDSDKSGNAVARALSVSQVPVLDVVPAWQVGNVPVDPVTF